MQKLDRQSRRLLVSTALVALPSESMVCSVLNDNPLCIHGEAYRQQVIAEIVKLDRAPWLMWEWLAALLEDTPAWELQDMVLNGSMC
eukprot:5003001-Amphidinium_carterae.1